MTSRQLYALTDWVVEKRADGWWFTRYRDRQGRQNWRGPYSSEASIALMVARQLRKEIAARQLTGLTSARVAAKGPSPETAAVSSL